MKYIFNSSLLIVALLITSCTTKKSNSNKEQIDDYSAKIDSLIKTTNPRKFNGVVLITQNGEIKYSKEYGYSNFEKKTPISLNDNFRIQSNSKQITAVLILKEVEKGRINLQSPIKEYLPDFEQTWTDTVTVHQLLNMSSGIVSLEEPLLFKPGTDFKYSNPAYGLLGRIIENTTGEEFKVVANRLFKDLGMENTYCYEMNKTYPKLINGYRISGDKFELLEFESFRFSAERWKDFIPGGGIISNVTDLNIWDSKLHNGDILKQESYEAMVNSDVIDFNEAFSTKRRLYGYGINISDKTDVKYIGHAGRGMGFANIKFYIPEKNIGVIILENVYNANTDIIYHFEKEVREIVLNSNLVK